MVAKLNEIEHFKHKPKHHGHHGHHGAHRRHRRPRIVNWISDWSTPIRYTPPVVINRPPHRPQRLLDVHTNLLTIIIIRDEEINKLLNN